jgi:hypothetical protein
MKLEISARSPNGFPRILILRWACIFWAAATAYFVVTADYDGWGIFIAILVGFSGISAVLEALLWAVWAVVPFAALAMAVKRVRSRDFRAAVPWLLAPLFAVFVATAEVAFYPWVRDLGDVVMLQIHKPSYDRIVREVSSGRCTPADQAAWQRVAIVECQPTIVVIMWGERFLSSWYGVVYDASDEIARPWEKRSQQWKATKSGQALVYADAWKPLGGHYYLASGE